MARGAEISVGRVVRPARTQVIEYADHSGVRGMRWGGRTEELQRMLDQPRWPGAPTSTSHNIARHACCSQ